MWVVGLSFTVLGQSNKETKMAREITRKELIILAGLSATVYPEEIKKDGSMYRVHDSKEIEYVKQHGVRITRVRGSGLRVVVGGVRESTR